MSGVSNQTSETQLPLGTVGSASDLLAWAHDSEDCDCVSHIASSDLLQEDQCDLLLASHHSVQVEAPTHQACESPDRPHLRDSDWDTDHMQYLRMALGDDQSLLDADTEGLGKEDFCDEIFCDSDFSTFYREAFRTTFIVIRDTVATRTSDLSSLPTMHTTSGSSRSFATCASTSFCCSATSTSADTRCEQQEVFSARVPRHIPVTRHQDEAPCMFGSAASALRRITRSCSSMGSDPV